MYLKLPHGLGILLSGEHLTGKCEFVSSVPSTKKKLPLAFFQSVTPLFRKRQAINLYTFPPEVSYSCSRTLVHISKVFPSVLLRSTYVTGHISTLIPVGSNNPFNDYPIYPFLYRHWLFPVRGYLQLSCFKCSCESFVRIYIFTSFT